MFTWICPQCGHEVPPAYTECPNCAGKPAAAAQEPAPQQPAPAPTAPLQAAYYPPPRRRAGMPTWLLTIVFAFAFLGIGSGIYWLVGAAPSGVKTQLAAAESPAAKPGTAANPFQKFIEVSGVRFLEDPKSKSKVSVRFLLTNHSTADITGLTGNVTLWGSTKRSEEDPQGTFAFAASLSPNDSKEITAPLNTKLKIYELGDWQNLTADVQVTAPRGS